MGVIVADRVVLNATGENMPPASGGFLRGFNSYSALSEAISIEKRYFTSPLSILS
jgi:hypothetical protein